LVILALLRSFDAAARDQVEIASLKNRFQTAKLWRGCRDVARDRVERRMISGYFDFTTGSAFKATGQLATRGAPVTAN